MSDRADFGKHIEEIATAMLQATHGAPNMRLSIPGRELRFGKKGSMVVDIAKGTWHDKEADEGGGALDLLKLYGDMTTAEALEWMVSRRMIEPTRNPNEGARQGGAPADGSGKFMGFMDRWPIATFDYHDEKGGLAYRVLKFDKTSDGPPYMQIRPAPDGKDVWIFGLQAGEYGQARAGGNWSKARDDKRYQAKRDFAEATRYLLDEAAVRKAIKKGEPIVLVEGEKDARTVQSFGLTATTNAGGAKFWTDRLTEALRGANVVLCGDNDTAGRQGVILRGASLRNVAKSVRVVDLAKHWKDMPEKGDVSDWKAEGGGTAEQFKKLVDSAPAWKPERIASKYNAIGWADMDAAAPEFEYLVEGWVPLEGRSVMGGPSQAGKSFLALDMALSVARGVDWLGCPVTQGGVIYQAGEGGTGAKKRVLAYRNHFQVSGEADIPFTFIPSKIDLFAKDGDTQSFIDEVNSQKLLLSAPLRLIVIDTLATATAGADENSGKDMGVVLANIAKIEKACHAHVMLVHHMNAGGQKLRGHTSIFADVDAVITITNDEETKVRTATLSKQKDDETGITLKFELMAIKTGFNERLKKDITSCVVLPKGEKEILKAEAERQGVWLTKAERGVMATFFEAEKRSGFLVDEAAKAVPAAVGFTAIRWDDYIDAAMLSEMDVGDTEDDRKRARDRLRKQFDAVKNGLLKVGIIGVERSPNGAFLWWRGKALKGFPRTFPKKTPAQAMWSEETGGSSYTSPGLDEVFSEPEIPF